MLIVAPPQLKDGHIHSTTTRRDIYTALPQGGTYTQHYHKEKDYKCIAFIYRKAGIFRGGGGGGGGVKFSWMFKFSSIRGLMFVVCDVHDHTCLKL